MNFVLLATCADVPGISAAVTAFLTDAGGFIADSQQYGDEESGRFFLRITFTAVSNARLDLEELRKQFRPVAERFAMSWQIAENERPRVLFAVSKFGHCLNDLLFRWRSGTLPVDVIGVLSNHEAMRGLTDWHGVPFHHLPVSAVTKSDQEARFRAIIEEERAELVVLARYMQILSDGFAAYLSGRCINIHHSFLPSFKGAKPYHQAHDRGVKIIGATAHYVTAALDEGPIIEQDVERVDHSWPPAKLVEAGHDIESRVLARAVRWHAERRILINGNKTVVFK